MIINVIKKNNVNNIIILLNKMKVSNVITLLIFHHANS